MRVVSLTLVLLIASVAAAPVHAQVDARPLGIGVSGSGTVKCRPDVVKIGVRVHSKAELTDDALVKYRDARKRLDEAVTGLKLKNARLKEQNVSIASGAGSANSQMMMMNGMAAPTETTQPTEITANMYIELTELKDLPADELLKTVGKILDTAKDAGGSLGPSQAEMNMAYRYGQMPSGMTVQFVLRDFQEIRDQAYALAVADARKRAVLLAKLYDAKLGKMLSVQEVHVAGDGQDYGPQYNYYGYNQNQGLDRNANEITSTTFVEIPVSVRLMVRFDIALADAKASVDEKAVADEKPAATTK